MKLKLLALCAVLFFSLGLQAQTRQRIVFKKKYAEVSGTIKGAEKREFVFRVRRIADVEIWIERERNKSDVYPKFALLKPNGKLFYDEKSVNYGEMTDLMDILPQAGDYIVRLQLPEDMRGDGKPVKFTLKILLKN